MLAAIKLYDEHGRRADEVDDETTDGQLSTELKADKTPVAKEPPHPCFGFGRVSSHRLRT
jgi:hypothetical protein